MIFDLTEEITSFFSPGRAIRYNCGRISFCFIVLGPCQKLENVPACPVFFLSSIGMEGGRDYTPGFFHVSKEEYRLCEELT